MKSYSYLLVAFALLAGSLFWSCQPTSSTPEADDASPVPLKNCSDECLMARLNSYEISESCATCMQEKFAENSYKLPEVGGKKARGFQINQKELKQILDQIANDSTAEVYAMLAIVDRTDDKGNEEPIPEMIFTVQQTDAAGNVRSTYYDFTSPCPDFCPEVK